MSSSETFKSKTPMSKGPNPKPQVLENEPLSSKTPEKPRELRHRARNCNTVLSIEQVRRSAAKSLFKSSQKQRTDLDQVTSWPEKSPKKKTRVCRPVKLPEKYEMLADFFNCLDISIGRLRKKGMKSSFTNIRSTIENLTDRRFSYNHLAQLKFILPEVIGIRKVLVWDDKTSCRKPDLHITMNADAVENDGKLKYEGGGIMHLRRAFRKRLADISKSHLEDYEIPEETLPHPFNSAKQHMHSDKDKFPSSSSPSEVLTGVSAFEEPAAPTIGLQSEEIPVETRPMPSNQSNEDLISNINEISKLSLPIKTSLPKKEQPAIGAHPSLSFRRHSSWIVTSTEIQAPSLSVPESNLNAVCSTEETYTGASSYGKVPASPTKEIDPIENYDGLTKTSLTVELTPAKVGSTPARLMTTTPALHPPKRCYMSPDDYLASSPNKLVRRAPCSRSLKFNTPVKNKMLSPDDHSTISPKKLVRRPPCSRSLKFDAHVKNNMFEEEILEIDGASVDTDIFDVLSEDLLQSLRDKERKAIEERNAAILEAKRRRLISSLPELFNMIHFLFQSMNYSFMKKEDLVNKIIFSHSHIDEGEVEEQLKLLLELVPEWISEKLSLIKINRMSKPESIRAQLEEAN